MKPKLTDDQVLALRAARSAGESQTTLAREYGISRATVAAIVEGRTYRHLPIGDNPKQEPGRYGRAVSNAELAAIQKLWADGVSGAFICRQYGIAAPVLSNYVQGSKLPPGPEWQRVDPTTGAHYRDTLIKIARGHEDPADLARRALGLEE